MFSRGTKVAIASGAASTKTNHSEANFNASLQSKFASSFQLGGGKSSSSRATSLAAHPSWLKDGSSLKLLPGIYQGVLGQVQLQPALVNDSNKFTNGIDKLISKQRQHQADYMDRFTDTERVHQLLSTSRLSNEILATIWAHVNKTFPGQLTNREVCLALALIAIFQRLSNSEEGPASENATPTDPRDYQQDPFSLLKLEKKPPAPKLYPNETCRPTKARIPGSSSVPNDIGSSGLLIDITDDDEHGNPQQATIANNNNNNKSDGSNYAIAHDNNFAISLIDMDDGGNADGFEANFARQTEAWIRFMASMKNLFKRSFDILNVENCRSSALEALSTPEGISFCKHLSVCYPLAHNIKCKIDELKRVLDRETANSQEQTRKNLLDDCYTKQIDDLMVSINEYWAVLINLFHEAGLTNFIELIMDGLNRQANKTQTFTTQEDAEGAITTSPSLERLKHEFTSASNRRKTCSLCLTEFYLVNMGDALEASANWHEDDIELVFDTKLITQDECFYYHPKCANFWLNNVPHTNGKLPFQSASRDLTILQPTTTATTTTSTSSETNNKV